MEIVDIVVEYPSGLSITDRATFIADLDQVCISERLAFVIQHLSQTEPPPKVSARGPDCSLQLEASVDGTFHVASKLADRLDKIGLWAELVDMVRSPTRDQRQQFGRFMHTLSAAAVIGAISFWHTTSSWSVSNILSEVNLVLAVVITFNIGMVSMNGE
ncbi:hypothetical protein [Paraburkholderia atlantica]|uniref:Uncharacterized protein n=1 Tax=Paraburkholderia atlantica TaxID=2654982 RepID=D5WNU7_PARAM|nr:hypothetical protein [Paraburkholderia atlantica]ADG20976.1 conserved hypothetical protein [Paraburkholderia atlantica]MBB5511248.1 hypothetical protein [Paraburkholderia atlantica]